MKYRGLFILLLLPVLFFYTSLKIEHLLPGQKILSKIVSGLLLLLIIAWQVIYRINPGLLSSKWYQLLAWSGSLCMGFWATYLLVVLPFDLVYFFKKLIGSMGFLSPLDSQRRDFILGGLPLGLVGVTSGIASFGFFEVLSGPKVKEVNIPIHGLPKGLHGLTIAQITDLHVGPTIQKDYVQNVVRLIMELKPDIIALTGDLVDGIPEVLDTYLKPLAMLSAPLGVYYVTGNHEYYWGAEQWIDKFRQLGFIPLLNENRVVKKNGAHILIGGVTDTSAHQFIDAHLSDPMKAIASDKATDFKLLLAHRPDSCFGAETVGFDVQLSGHTHAGQFFPWSILVGLVHKYYRGLNRHGKMWVYVSAGTGYWGPAHRFLVPSEITLVRLETV